MSWSFKKGFDEIIEILNKIDEKLDKLIEEGK